ncbi:hypothetical protein GGX14DRAFT_430674 [Mycena pura]|uniref:Uncharacterized protein n=1 Tax=Mycena pura TaxID=153505 RepID=A0AAD6VSX3_9AGAR|nr:hypothetical protein GGX14DRAFT_430674 [Mycena pura]
MTSRSQWAQEIYDQVWIKGNDCTTVTNGVKHLTSIVSASGDDDLIIIREEYLKIWSYIEEASGKLNTKNRKSGIPRGLVVWGHPGIGKSLFLLYALVQALLAKKPVALCRSPFHFDYFDKDGVTRIKWADAGALKLPPGVIALFDTLKEQESPHNIFIDRLNAAYVVQATSPKVSQYKEWSKQLRAELWPMPLWSRAELQQLDDLNPRDTTKYYTCLQLADFLGPTPRACSDEVKIGTDLSDDFTPLNFTNAYANSSQGLHFHDFFFAGVVEGCGVKRASSDPKTYCHYYIPTRLLRQVALKTFRQMSIEEQQRLCHTFSAHPQLCGAFYEVLGPKVVVADGLVCRFPRRDGSAVAEHFLPAELHILESDDDAIVDPSHFTTDRLWIPPPNFPSVDAVAVLESGRLVRMIQLTIARRHDIKEQGIARVIVKFSAIEGVRYELVFIAPTDEIGRKLALTRGGERTARRPYALRVKNTPHVGPVGNASTERPAPPEPFTIPVGYAIAGFIKADDLSALLVGGFSILDGLANS